ncbi:hypothetical protein P168DRAFT_319892 [Aspergillus campestris IBT 28561]|uniref:Uncharacterized protein n=1 Tax=Aspergillus campestris (strain IBT 28561) TaxID=1392248 RepID=A0A2I1D0G9_ASPC2|nr:uncharacterized protein P168DRAFT_319892 [Aspergillus campestris IBT 28561]PKY03362.1 hypothetical protein P168DRAFT_319892 [Aspergillus campestris IBT 28561]
MIPSRLSSISLAALRPTQATASRSTQLFARRSFATQPPQHGQRSSDVPYALGALILGGGGAFLLLQSGPEKKPHHEPIKEQAAQYVKGTQESVTGEKSNSSFEQPPSTVDPASSRKEAGGYNSMSGKQEGLSNATSDNPYINDPSQSNKGEGESDSVKVKGTISPSRPQA